MARLDAPPFVCSPQTTFWRVIDSEKLDRRFLYSYMRSRQFRDQWFLRKGETDMADYVSLTAQRQLRVAIPPIEEQRAIASILGAIDDKIELNRDMNRTLEAMAQALFKSWFVDFDPVVAKAVGGAPVGMDTDTAAMFPNRFVESELGPIPEGWEWGTIADLARYVNGRNFTRNATGAGRMVIRIAELNSGPGGSTVYNEVETTPDHVAEPGDVLFAWSGSLGIYRWYRPPALINQHIFKVLCQQFPSWFVHQHLLEALPNFRGIAADKATTMGHIRRSHLSEIEVALPKQNLLNATTPVFAPLYQLILENELQSATLTSLRDALLPELLSGQIRLQNSIQKVAEVV
jgi:type I restriction enzyme S subunit